MTTPAPGPAARAVDPDFLALPLEPPGRRRPVAARQGGASHAELRVERDRESDARVRDRRLEGAAEREAAGLSVRVLHDGTWGFAATTDAVHRRRGPGAARTPSSVARTSAALRRERIELADEPVYPAGTWVSAYRRQPLRRRPRRNGPVCCSSGPPPCSISRASTTPTPPCWPCRRTSSTPTWPAPPRCRSGSGCTPPPPPWRSTARPGEFDTMRTLAPPTGRGWEYLTGDGMGLGRRAGRRCPSLLAEKMAAPAVEAGDVRPGHRPVQPVAHHPRVDRARHRAGPGPRVRGRLRRDVVRHLRPARHPAVRRPVHARDRRSHGRARAGLGGLGRRGGGGPVLGSDPRRRPGRLPAGPAHGGPAGPRPIQRLRLRRLQQPRAPAAHGERVAAARRPAGRAPKS